LPRPLHGPKVHHVRDSSSQTAIRFGFRAPGLRDREEVATELLLRVIDDGTSTRLYHRLCDDGGLCYDVSALYEAHESAGLVELAADCSHANALEVADEVLAMCRELSDAGPTAAEIEKAKARMSWQLEAMLDSPADLASFYGFAELFGVARTPERRLAEFRRVGRDDVRAAARRLFRSERLALLTVGALTKRQARRLADSVRALG
jgi:predicted Zn-dependent peptidase